LTAFIFIFSPITPLLRLPPPPELFFASDFSRDYFTVLATRYAAGLAVYASQRQRRLLFRRQAAAAAQPPPAVIDISPSESRRFTLRAVILRHR
jgi:hypothetical protein